VEILTDYAEMRFLTIDSPQHSFAKQMQGELEFRYIFYYQPQDIVGHIKIISKFVHSQKYNSSMANTKDNLKSLQDIFVDNVHFIIPDYQRGYSWTNEQLDALWEDIENITEDRCHYTGMFTFCKDENNRTLYQVVDGQQRMTTFIILINALLSKIEGGIDGGMGVNRYREKYLYYKPFGAEYYKYKFQYSTDDPSDTYFKSHILKKEISSDLFPEHTLYTRNLQNAKDYFDDKLKHLDNQGIIEIFIKVTEKLKFNEYLIEDMDEVYVTFETMNNRGKSLSSLELLKNRLIYLSTLFSIKYAGDQTQMENVSYLRSTINIAWKSIYELLGKSTKKTLNDDAFLRDHWIMYFRYDRSASMVFRKDLLSVFFTAQKVHNNQLSIANIIKYVNSLHQSIQHWFNINCPSESKLDDESKEWLTRLNRIGIGSFRPLLMAAYVHCKTTHDILPLVQACERFRFLVSSVTARRSNTSDSEFYTLAHKYYENPNDYDLVDKVNALTNYWTHIPNFVNASIDRYKKQEGFYSWPGLRYFLYEYEKHLQAKNEIKVNWETFEKNQSGKISIEHIFPQSPNDEYWTERFTTEEDYALTHSLGNLLLLSKSKNSELQNGSFDKKKKTIVDEDGNTIHSGYDTGSHSEINVSKYEEWTPSSIKERGKKMLEFLQKHWGLNEFSPEEINQLLNISNSIPPIINSISESSIVAEEDNEDNLDVPLSHDED
jgi:hypothetical protein